MALEGDAEAFQFAGVLYKVVEAVGWTIEGCGQVIDIVEVWVGLKPVRSRIDKALHGGVLLRSLRTIGFEVSEKIHPAVAEGVGELIVGQKPRPRN
jgi:hypothetical protein